ncbi:MAG: acyl carrier protein [Methylococcaceae bacterium]
MEKKDVANWLVINLSKVLDINVNDIDQSLQFEDYGLDSITAVGLVGELAQWLKQELDPSIIYDYPSIDFLSEYIVEELFIKTPQTLE